MACSLLVLRLTLFLLCVGLALSRAGLVLHEVVGHGGVATAFGGRLRQVELFWFGGGWVKTTTPAGSGGALPVALGGIAVELVAAAALGLLARRWRHTARGAIAALGAFLLVAHALWYASTGLWHGFGDGAILHQRLGWARHPVALGLAAALCAVAFAATRSLCRAIAPALDGPWRRRLAVVLAAAALAGGAHAALAYGELAVRRDETYRLTMRTAAQRTHETRLAELEAELRRRGRLVLVPATGADAARPAPPRPFPFAWVLAGSALLAVAAAAWSLRNATPNARGPLDAALAPGGLALAAAAALSSVLAVAAIGSW